MRHAHSPFNQLSVVPPRRDKDFAAWEPKPAPPAESWWLTADPGKSFTGQCVERFKVGQKPDKGALPSWGE